MKVSGGRLVRAASADTLASFDRVARRRRPAGAGQDAAEFVKQIGLAKRVIEFSQPGANPVKVQSVVNLQNPLDVGDVPGRADTDPVVKYTVPKSGDVAGCALAQG